MLFNLFYAYIEQIKTEPGFKSLATGQCSFEHHSLQIQLQPLFSNSVNLTIHLVLQVVIP